MEPGDSIIDGGNEWYLNIERRIEQASLQGLLYLGMGVSGGEEGARYGPSLMPGDRRWGLGTRGMEWILTCLEDKRDWVPSHGLLSKRFRENGKLLEFCGRSNNAVSLNNGGGGGQLAGGGRSGKSMSVYGESLSGVGCGDSELPECVAVQDLVLNASTLNADPVLVASVASPSGSLEGAAPNVVVRATVAPVYELEFNGCTLMFDSGALGAVVVVPDSGKVGSTSTNTVMVSPTLKNGSRSHRRHQWAKHNRFSPLFELGNEMGTEFGEGEDRVKAFRSVDSVGLSPNDSGPLFLPWDNSGADNCDGGSGVKDNCLLE
nr:6-phosphogluconate dehydrogenase, decarboxylating 1, chloroplastic [Quercus suber]